MIQYIIIFVLITAWLAVPPTIKVGKIMANNHRTNKMYWFIPMFLISIPYLALLVIMGLLSHIITHKKYKQLVLIAYNKMYR